MQVVLHLDGSILVIKVFGKCDTGSVVNDVGPGVYFQYRQNFFTH